MLNSFGMHWLDQWKDRKPGLDVDCAYAQSLQLCLTLCHSMDCSLPGSSVHGILQAIAKLSSRGSSWPRDWTGIFLHCTWILYHLSHLGSPHVDYQVPKIQTFFVQEFAIRRSLGPCVTSPQPGFTEHRSCAGVGSTVLRGHVIQSLLAMLLSLFDIAFSRLHSSWVPDSGSLILILCS